MVFCNPGEMVQVEMVDNGKKMFAEQRIEVIAWASTESIIPINH
jgi:hypothetical protein